MLAFICLILGIVIGYFLRGVSHSIDSPAEKTIRRYQAPLTQQQRLYLKSFHQSDSDRIRELNLLNANQSVFLRLLKQIFLNHEIAIKQQRFILLDQDQMPRAIFEYRDGNQAMKLVDQEDGLPLFLYKGLISSDELKQDYFSITASGKLGSSR